MQIWETGTDWGKIIRRAIIIIQIITIIILLTAIPAKQATTKPKEKQEEPKYFIMEATAYYPGEECCWPYADGKTAYGHEAGKGSIAFDPDAGILKPGQKVYIPGYGHGICNDTGGAIKGWKIDLCFDTLQEAKEFGRQLVKVYLTEG